jgi:hypothetical protein
LSRSHGSRRGATPNGTERPGSACTEGRELADKKPKRTAPSGPLRGMTPSTFGSGGSLHGAFDSALEEPVPEEVLRLIEEDRAERERIRRRRTANGAAEAPA